MTLGVRDLKTISLPPGWDAAELSSLRLADGTTYESLIRDIDAAIQAANANLTAGYLGRLAYLTTDPVVEYRSGGTGGFEDHTEMTQPDRQYAKTTGHMLPIRMKDRAMGWTHDVLRKMRRSKMDADINAMIEDAINAYEKSVWVRFFKYEKDTGELNGLGATGISVPFADAGNAGVAFIPPPQPSRDVSGFSATHNHYMRLNGITQANLETALLNFWEHGYDGPYELIVSLADLGSWQNTTSVTGFVPKQNALIQYGQLNDLALVEQSLYQGAVNTKYGTCQIYANARIPTGYWGITQLFGANDPRAPLRVRYADDLGFGIRLVTQNLTRNPFEAAIGQFEFGVGVGESRVAAVLVENDSDGDYATPSIA